MFTPGKASEIPINAEISGPWESLWDAPIYCGH
jgi:hypothetical protein